uniref:YprB ribonuclease H-like domain-containing protein n=1 Tax=Gracilinema caldarium TaxID=215591 RepID=A0A7C3INX2_9SPIR
MAGNLKARLERIRSQGSGSIKPLENLAPVQGSDTAPAGIALSFPPPWLVLDPLVLFRRELIPLKDENRGTWSWDSPVSVPPDFLEILFHTGRSYTKGLCPEELLFFDLETTGLSGGAGTVAFLAAFGEIRDSYLEVRQYLLLDYPGEPILISYIEQELNKKPAAVLVSYNGKAFDTQILRSRFILQGKFLPDKDHIDLLYISRLLWRGLLPSCSLSSLESLILQNERQGDIPGALAPQLWFSFLREGTQGQALKDLLAVCEHNLLDIKGLAALFSLILSIGANPLGSLADTTFNLDRLALVWPDGENRRRFLHEAARGGSARALYELARLARLEKDWERYRQYLEEVLESPQPKATGVRLRASIALASYYEWKKRDLEHAEVYTRRALGLLEALSAERLMAGAKGPPPSINMKLKKRLERILSKSRL